MKRAILRATTAVAAVSAAALFFPSVASAAPVPADNCATISTGDDANGWGNPFPEELAGKHSATNVAGADTDGSLEFVTNNSIARQASYHSGGGAPLADVIDKGLTFDKSAGNANWQIRVNKAATGNQEEDGFATLVWVAPDAAGSANPANSDQWWATRALPGIPRGTTATLAVLEEAAGPDTTVTDYGISSQPGGTGGTVNVDNVSFNGCTTNFALKSPVVPEVPGGDGSSSGSLGGLGLTSLLP